MKRVHVLAVTFLAGLIVGCAIPAHATEVKEMAHGVFSCDNHVVITSGASATIDGKKFPLKEAMHGDSYNYLSYGDKDNFWSLRDLSEKNAVYLDVSIFYGNNYARILCTRVE